MDKLDTILDGLQKHWNITSGSSEKENLARQGNISAASKPACSLCSDVGWVQEPELEMTRKGHMQNVLTRCSCKATEDKAKRSKFLLEMDGLTPQERKKSFAAIDEDSYEVGILHVVRQAVQIQRGLITLTGKPGVGKTTLLICAVNEARNLNKLAIYTTMSDLLSYLRSTFRPEAEDDFDRYWNALVECEVLGLDELDEFASTPWAAERFLRLFDERWRRMDEVLTLCATNNRVQSLQGKIQSRLRDGRAQIITIEGHDMRPANSWD